jgi:hypothetical protein
MPRLIAAIAVSTTLAAAHNSQGPTPDLAVAPANARHFVIQSTGGKHGDAWTWVGPDGAEWAARA